jgi:hypothetical protein
MAKKTYVWRKDKEGKMRCMELTERLPHIPGESTDSFEARILSTLYQKECEEGSRFRVPGYSNNQLKEVWRNAA